jgi:mitochondrial fission protein ELM1
VHEAGRHLRSIPPRVWLLSDDRPGCTGQAEGLAAALGWPTERKRLVFNRWSLLHNRLLGASRLGVRRAGSSPLTPPWPDLVIAAGRRNAPVAQWIRDRSGGAARVILLGRKAGDAADTCDLAVTPSYARLFPHPRRLATLVPLQRSSGEDPGAERWRETWASLPRPRIAALVGGRSGQYQLSPAVARRLGEDLARLARSTGGTILATTSRRTGAAAAAALSEGLGAAGRLHTWRSNDADNPYLGLLAAADAFVVTCDSESMLAEALAVGRSVAIYPLPTRRSFTALRLPREWVSRWAGTRRIGRRGTARPQKGLAYAAARSIDRGWVRPVRDLEPMHAELIARGLARRFGDRFAAEEQEPVNELAAVAERVRRLMGV